MDKNTPYVEQEVKELSLEEIDVLCRKYHHMHDEEVLRICSRFFHKMVNLFKSNDQQPYHSPAR